MPQMVSCIKLGRILPGLDQPPLPGDLGFLIYENVSKQAWTTWDDFQQGLINQYNLIPNDPTDREFLMQQTEEFFFGTSAQTPEEWLRQHPQKAWCSTCWSTGVMR